MRLVIAERGDIPFVSGLIVLVAGAQRRPFDSGAGNVDILKLDAVGILVTKAERISAQISGERIDVGIFLELRLHLLLRGNWDSRQVGSISEFDHLQGDFLLLGSDLILHVSGSEVLIAEAARAKAF